VRESGVSRHGKTSVKQSYGRPVGAYVSCGD
jgi:hypothetical protein